MICVRSRLNVVTFARRLIEFDALPPKAFLALGFRVLFEQFTSPLGLVTLANIAAYWCVI
jgi:hypothetical protein